MLTESATNHHPSTPHPTQAGAPPAAQASGAYQQLLTVAERLYRQDPDWVTFFREVLGIEGAVRRALPNFDDLTEFERSHEYAEIQRMMVKLREKKETADAETEPTRVITVRLPKSMHEYLRTEAHDLRTSMNKLCISKLLQMIEQDMVPTERTAPPKRRPAAPTPASPMMSSATHHADGSGQARSSY